MASVFMEMGLHAHDPGVPASFSEFRRWRPPDVGIYKLNIGICMRSNSMQAGLGFLIRDGQGFVVAAMQQQVARCEDKLQLQALVVLTAVQFAFDVGLRYLDIELTFSNLLSLLNSDGSCLAPIGTLVDDILCVKQLFHFCQFSFTKILCNKAALALASEALSSSFSQVWLEDCPPCIVTLVQSDLGD
uniref:RNase H type-1 domain-containing protein n=1 Tax=Fagus sylvatica TaxID=28930 RepID=A0A2N9F4D6_FAGSY